MKKQVGMLAIVLVIAIPAVFNLDSSLAEPALQTEPFQPVPRVILVAQEGPADPSFTPPPKAFTELHAQTSTFIINWRTDGDCELWPVKARSAFEYAVAIWESIVSSPVTIEVDACWEDLTTKLGRPDVLGSAGAADYEYIVPNAPYTNTWYPSALANALVGTDLSPAYADIDASFNSTFSEWYFGTDDSTPAGKYNLATVALHEICHGLGFISFMSQYGIGAYWGWGNSGMPVIFDRFVENEAGQNLVAMYPSAAFASGASFWLLEELTSNHIFFDGPNANVADGGSRPQLYAPSEWRDDSSISHLDEKYNLLEQNHLMTYSLAPGKTTHDPGPIVKGIFQDIGWTIQDITPPDPELEPVSTTITPSGGAITASYGTTITVTFPAQAVSETITVTLAITDTQVATYTWETIGLVFSVKAVRFSDGTPVDHFSKTVTITIDYDDTDVWGVKENTLMLYYLDNGRWITATTTCDPTTTPLHDPGRNTFSLGICHLGKFTLFAKTHPIHLPAIFRNASGD